jgi:CHASE2 domain-containing sensor protein
MKPHQQSLPVAVPSAAEAPLVVLDRKYRLEQRLGEGATGVVYRAVHLGLKKAFAVKLLHASPDPLALARFRREAEALGQLRHPHVVEVTDFGIDDAAGGVPYLVLELLEGISLADFCRARGPLPLAQALPILEATAAAVDAAHARGILHRDLKPGNVLLCATEGEPLVKVLDFGLAELAGSRSDETAVATRSGKGDGESLTLTGALLGTPLYVAPEVIRHRAASRASDLYSFGVIAYELLAGRPPFQGSTAEVLAGHLDEEPPPPAPAGAPLPEEIWQALQEPLRKDPAQRPASAREVVERIRRAAERAELARWRAVEIPRRVRLSVLFTIALLLATLLLPWPVLPAMDRWLHGLRLLAAPARPPDSKILLVTLDDASLAEKQIPLADREDELGRTLSRVLAAGARHVAIDLLLPPQWGKSPAFSDLLVRNPEALTLAAFSEPDGHVTGADCVAGLTAAALGPDRTAGLFGFVNLDEDPDSVVRKGRLGYRDRSGRVRPSWAAKAAAALRTGGVPPKAVDPFWIDPRIDWPRYAQISWRDVTVALDRDPGLFRDRLVLVGGGFRGSGDDYHRVPHCAEGIAAVSALTLQAMLVDTIAAGLPVREPGRAPVLVAAALLLGFVMAGVLCARRPTLFSLLVAAAVALYIAISFPVFWWSGRMLPVSSPLLLALLGLSLALVVRRILPPAPEVTP